MEKGHYGEYSGNAKHSRVTASNYKASERDDAAHIDYLKRDVLYDNHHSHSDAAMTADEKHISHLAGDMKYDKKHHGSPASRVRTDLKSLQTGPERRLDLKFQEIAPPYEGPDRRWQTGTFKTPTPKPETQALDERSGDNGPSRESMAYRESAELKYDPIKDIEQGDAEGDYGMSRKSRSERLRGRAKKRSERGGAESGDYDYEDQKVTNMLEKARMLDERSGANTPRLEMRSNMTRHIMPLDTKGGKVGSDIGRALPPPPIDAEGIAQMQANMISGAAAAAGENIGRFIPPVAPAVGENIRSGAEGVGEFIAEQRDNELNRMMDDRGGMNRMSKYGGNKDDYHRHMDAQGHMTRSGVQGGGMYGKGGHYKDYEGMSRYSSPAAFMGIKKPGRCTPFPNSDCQPGSPQYNLAKRLKPGGDLYKGKKK